MIETKSIRLALAWLVPAVGATIFITMQCFSYMNEYIRSGGKMPAITFDSTMLWSAAIFYGTWVIPALLALAGRRATDWAMLVLGGSLFTLCTLGGVFDGLRDGSHLVALELLAVTLPGAAALIMSWRHIRSR